LLSQLSSRAPFNSPPNRHAIFILQRLILHLDEGMRVSNIE
jgi:hypothetical protein